MTRRRTTRLIAAALVAGAAIVSGCTRASDASDAARAAAESPAATTASTTAPASTSTSTTRPPLRDARLPDLDQEAPTEVVVKLETKSGRASWRLGFRSAVRNAGAGPLIVIGTRRDATTRDMSVAQVIERANEEPLLVPDVGRMRYTVSPDHQHWHYLQFERYELQRWELRPAGSDRVLVRDRKTGFCLGDRYRMQSGVPNAAPREAVYTDNCGYDAPELLFVTAGISVGYGDDYSAFLEGQDLAIDGIPDGRYVLVHRVNTDGRLHELSTKNNAASALLELRWERGIPTVRVVASCPDTADCDR
jgi:hypothetical protein